MRRKSRIAQMHNIVEGALECVNPVVAKTTAVPQL